MKAHCILHGGGSDCRRSSDTPDAAGCRDRCQVAARSISRRCRPVSQQSISSQKVPKLEFQLKNLLMTWIWTLTTLCVQQQLVNSPTYASVSDSLSDSALSFVNRKQALKNLAAPLQSWTCCEACLALVFRHHVWLQLSCRLR